MALIVLYETYGFRPSSVSKEPSFWLLHARGDSDMGSKDDDASEVPQAYRPSTVETSAELPERFNYKVQALMGNFDPPPGVADDERQDGNILNAMIKFPAKYTFNVVGKTGGDEKQQERYMQAVQRLVQETTGDEEIGCNIKPRGKNFTKVQCEATVQSATMINMIYDDLDELEMTVMRF